MSGDLWLARAVRLGPRGKGAKVGSAGCSRTQGAATRDLAGPASLVGNVSYGDAD